MSEYTINSVRGYGRIGAVGAVAVLLSAIATLAIGGVQRRGFEPVVPAPQARDVFNNYLFFERKLLVVAGNGEVLGEALERWREEFPMDRDGLRGLSPPVVASLGNPGDFFELTFVTADEVVPEALIGTGVVLVGTVSSNRLLAELGAAIPIRFAPARPQRAEVGAAFEFLGQRYASVGDVVNLRLRSPYDREMPLYLVTGNDDAEIARRFFRFLQRQDFEVLRHGQRTRFGAFIDGDHASGVERDHDLDTEVREGTRSSHYRLRRHHEVAAGEDLRAMLQDRERVRARVTEFLGGAMFEGPTEVVLFSTLEEKAHHTGTSRHTDFNIASGTLSLAVEGNLHALDWPREAVALTRRRLSKTVDVSLERAVAIGVDAIAIVPYARYPSATEPLPIGFFRSPSKETDGGVIHAALEAKKRGMRVLIKPQLEGPWPGSIKMASVADWDRFFHQYERFVVHYAMLAELIQADVLSIGVELVEATNGQDERWRQIANRAREVFGGDLVYAANWGGEFERVAFWDALDYIGIDSYYPLSGSDAPSDGELRAGADGLVERVRRVQATYGKPVLFTEIGYSGSEAPWKEPWADNRRAAPDPLGQARAFEAMTAAMQKGRDAGWIAGTYWWKWSTDMSRGGGPEDTSHRFHDKAAEGVLARWYGRRP